MNDDNLQNLLTKKQTFDSLYEEITALSLRIHQLHDSVQRNLDLDDNHMSILQLQREQSKLMIEKIASLLIELEKMAKGFEQKKQLKNAKQQFAKEKERYSQLSKEMNKISFSTIESDHQEQQQVQQFLDLENDLIRERQEDINHIEHQAGTLQKIMNELGLKVNEQDQQLDLIVHDLHQTKDNVGMANQEIRQAAESQQKTRTKYYALVLVASILFLGTLGALLTS